MRFPKLLKRAVLVGDKVCFSIKDNDISDLELIEYIAFKSAHKIKCFTRRKLLKLLKNNMFSKEIKELFASQKE